MLKKKQSYYCATTICYNSTATIQGSLPTGGDGIDDYAWDKNLCGPGNIKFQTNSSYNQQLLGFR